ncbi:YjbF family lipoprotein [Limimaricola pyoseonensis]|uniref:Group 4 capsule polysaccharide lipoprotein gfcB, YjbF n=1 Tax=Limimaricola pyoseonensis TaxID=521013 RepID=A0A1G7F0U3_9RHOB|nr:YjbF family lipoprotein [Limimaricola pyoseonensis]SDE69521.1 Group 4 capsule polysaccharide lipoprotein gfcB, YjbF [Limimaricola pyoseonensis]
MKTKLGTALLAATLVAGCTGSGGGGLAQATAGQLASLLRGEGPRSASGAVAAEGVSAEAIAAEPAAYLGLEARRLGLAEVARKVTDNGARETFATSGGITAAFDDGMLVATRGMIFDLLAADASQTRRALRQGGGTARRVHESLDGLDRVARSEFACEITPEGTETIDLGLRKVATRSFVERCEGSGLAFENAYWIDNAGEIVRSRQFVGQTVAYLRASRL